MTDFSRSELEYKIERDKNCLQQAFQSLRRLVSGSLDLQIRNTHSDAIIYRGEEQIDIHTTDDDLTI